jgi:hypothetical protein
VSRALAHELEMLVLELDVLKDRFAKTSHAGPSMTTEAIDAAQHKLVQWIAAHRGAVLDALRQAEPRNREA